MFKFASLTIAVLATTALAPASAQQRSNLGGGFIEFLATGSTGGGGARYAPPSAPLPQQQYQAPARRSYYGAPAYTAYGEPQAAPTPSRQAGPEITYIERLPGRDYSQALQNAPYGLVESRSGISPQPQPQPQPQKRQELAYAPAPMPRVQAFESKYEKQVVEYDRGHAPGTIIIDTPNKFLYLVEGGGKATRYGIGVGRPGFEWAGVKHVTRKAEWPDWRPPAEMRKRRPDLPTFMKGGEDNPLGARAMYLGSSLYRIHGTNEPSTIGQAVSSGCIRMRNRDVIDLYDRVRVGAKVVVI